MLEVYFASGVESLFELDRSASRQVEVAPDTKDVGISKQRIEYCLQVILRHC